MFDVEASDSEGVRKIVLVGEFDLAAMPTAEASLAEATANGYAAIEIDLRALTFLDSSGVRSLMITVAVGQREAERLIEGLSHGTLYLGLLTDSVRVSTDGGVDNTDTGGGTAPLFD